MDRGRVGRHIAFLCSRLEDPRSIQLREGAFLAAYRKRERSHDLVEIAHGMTKIRRQDWHHMRDSLAVFLNPSMFRFAFHHDREYLLHSTVPLPKHNAQEHSFAGLVRERRSCREFGGAALVVSEVGFILSCAIGETGRQTLSSGAEYPEVAVSLRAIPSGGALHPTRVFAVILKQGNLKPGIYHFDVAGCSLEVVRFLTESDISMLFQAFPIHPQVVDLTGAAVVLFITSKFWRSRAKYGPRGYRYCLQEAGAASQNVALAATALDLSHVVIGGFYDDDVHDFLGLDGIDHAVITSVAVGTRRQSSEHAPDNVKS